MQKMQFLDRNQTKPNPLYSFTQQFYKSIQNHTLEYDSWKARSRHTKILKYPVALDMFFSRGRKGASRALQCIFQFFLFLKFFFHSKNTSLSLFRQKIKGFVDIKLLINLHHMSSLIGLFYRSCKSSLLRGRKLILQLKIL